MDTKSITLKRKINKKSIISRAIQEIITGLLIILWAYTGISKLMDHDETLFNMARSPFIDKYALFLSWLVPITELSLVVLLSINKFRLIGYYISLFLLTSFTIYIYAMLNYSYYLPCSCGGVLNKMTWQDHLYFNIGYTILTIIGILIISKTNK
ncbi:hypothetical protein COR50_02005 [Chitinophaga caeni]|uniref:Methylamine utilisation protein MauE domain-containing protein n=1 Tax=Chitinophaga caeni TaxID=2029983 RepID=A0A291QQ22_9BACT|nr:hypothetical protein COR50_02005 [Chitinophaga caeni]